MVGLRVADGGGDLLASTLELGGVLEVAAPHGAGWLFFGVIAVTAFGPLLARTLRIPTIVSLLVGGFVIGPHGLKVVPADDPTLPDLGHFGLLYLMFTIGLELDINQFHRYRRAAVLLGVTSCALPMALGFAAGRLLGHDPTTALLVGTVCATHTLVTYPVVRGAGLSGNRAVAATVGATVLTDTLALVVLAGLVGAETGERSTVAVVVSLTVGLGLLATYTALVIPWMTRHFFGGPARERETRFIYLLAAMLSGAVLAEVMGIEAIVGALFAGLGLNRLVPADGPLMQRVEFLGNVIFVPLFLVSVGVLIDPSVMARPGTLGLASVFSVVVVAGKAAAAALSRPVLRFSWGEAGLIFGLTLPHAAATLAATFVGHEIGLLSDQVVNAVLVVVLVSLVAGALVTEHCTRRIEPVPDASKPGRRVLVPVAGIESLPSLARVARLLTAPDTGSIQPVRLSRMGSTGAELDHDLLDHAERTFGHDGLDVEAKRRVCTDPARDLAGAAEEEAGSLVLLRWQPTTRQQSGLRGGRDDHLLAEAPVPVVLAALEEQPHKRVVLGVTSRSLRPAGHHDLHLATVVAQRMRGPDRQAVSLAVGDEPDRVDLDSFRATGPEALVSEIPETLAVSGSRWDQQLEADDLLVLTADPVWEVFGPAVLAAATRPGVSVLAVADPSRWPRPVSLAAGGDGHSIPIESYRATPLLWP